MYIQVSSNIPLQGEPMNIKRGVLVNHPGANSWGVGKVTEVALLKATILFSDGITRMIASSHYNILQPAEPGSFIHSDSGKQCASKGQSNCQTGEKG